MDIRYDGADHSLTFEGVTDEDGTVQADAVVQVTTIVDQAGQQVSGPSYPVLGSHIAGGTYRVPLTRQLQTTPGQSYTARGTVTLANGKQRPFEVVFRAHVWRP